MFDLILSLNIDVALVRSESARTLGALLPARAELNRLLGHLPPSRYRATLPYRHAAQLQKGRR